MERGRFARYNKLWLALSGGIANAVTNGFVDGGLATWLTAGIALVTAAGVFAIPNAESV